MLKPLIFLFASGGLCVAMAATLSIGVVQSKGDFRINGSTIVGNTTLFEGNLIETNSTRSIVQLPDAHISLSPESRAKLFRNHTILERGTGVIMEADKHVIEASTLRIAPTTRDSVIQVEVTGPTQIAVASRKGSAEIRNASGILVASLNPGKTLALNAQAGAPTSVTMSGQVISKGGNYFLTDTTTNVTVQLEGSNVAKYAGKHVVINGSIVSGSQPAGGASEIIHITSISNLAAGGAGAAGSGGGLTILTKAAVIGGVSAAGAVIGLAAAGSFTGTTTVSR